MVSKEEVELYLQLKEKIEARAEEVCKEHFKKQENCLRLTRNNLVIGPSYEGFDRLDDFRHQYPEEQQWIVYRTYDYDQYEGHYIPANHLWEDIEIKDIVSGSNAKVYKKYAENLLIAEAKEKEEYLRLKEKYGKG